jgi:hypothetical protein
MPMPQFSFRQTAGQAGGKIALRYRLNESWEYDKMELMEDYFLSELTPEEIQKEKNKARELRASQWWKRKKSVGICHYCQQKFKPSELTMDHIVPISRGGKNNKGNVVPACKACNSKKKHFLPIEMVPSPE